MSGEAWDTVRTRRRVLAVARNVTTAGRLLDVLPVFDADPRVRTTFTTVDGSAFGAGLDDFLREIQADVLPWEQAVETPFDLALSATANGDLHRVRAPLMLMPHGAGHNRLLRTRGGIGAEVSGLAASQLMRHGRVLPSAIALSSDEQLARLGRSCPAAVPYAVVTGDPCFDRILANLPRRERHRRALGVPPGGRLVLVTSTWGEHSLFGAGLDLVERLTGELPMDEYTVAAVAHPNIWTRYGKLQVRAWLAGALARGLVLIPPERGWQAALIAADVVIGDHGSVTFYGAALDLPTLTASSGAEFEELDQDSPTAELSRRLPRLDRRHGLLGQVEEAVAAHLPGTHADVTGRTLGLVGRSGEALRRVAYKLMDLPGPGGSAVPAALPEPSGEREDVTAFVVRVEREPGRASVRRFPAGGAEGSLVVCVEELDRRLLESAEIIFRYGEPHAWPEDLLTRYPGSTAVAVISGHEARVMLRDGRRVVVAPVAGEPVDPACLPAVVSDAALGDVVIRVGAREGRYCVTPPG